MADKRDDPSKTATDRRETDDRRATARRAEAQRRREQKPVAEERREGKERREQGVEGGERRKVERRINEYRLAPDVLEFINAVNKFKSIQQKPFPTWSEIYEIFVSLGYSKNSG